MPPFLQQTMAKLKSMWGERTLPQQILIAGLVVSVLVVFVLLVVWLNTPDYKVLYANLSAEDANRVVTMLKEQKVGYKLENNGTTILVPADQVYDTRLNVAGEGGIRGQGVGYEIFDNVKIGQTDFVQQINYQRALQGELSRTISEFPEVERARVHLVLPHKSLFIEEQAPPTASVVLKLREGAKLEKKQIQAITNLVSMSVESLEPSNITLTDTSGLILYQPDDDTSIEGLTSSQLEYKSTMERNIESRIEQLLTPVVGNGKVIARVNADLNFAQRTIKKELYDPDSAVVRSEQRSEEQTIGRANIEGGVPDPNFRGDGFQGSLSTQEANRETRTTNFEINREEQNIIAPVGELERLSVAVIVDGTWQEAAEGGESMYVARSEEEMARIQDLVMSAAGYDRARGDTVEVSNISFGEPDLYGGPTLLQTMMEYMQRLGKPFLNGLLIFLFLILIVRPVVMSLIKPRVAGEEVEELISLPEVEERLALEEGLDDEVLDIQRRLELAKAQALQLSEKDMDQAVLVLKKWIKQEA